MDAVPREIQQWIDRKYPKPTVDREWLAQCFEWAVGQEDIGPVPPYPTKLFKSIERQLLESNLADSMDLSTGLPENIGDIKTKLTLPGTPTLVEVVDKNDTGVSAFQLDQVRKAREERIRAGGFDENGEGDEEADIEVEGEGPLPKYPRATLDFVLSDGKTRFKALEYKPIPQLSLPQVPYGLKMQLKMVRIVAGVAYLEPSNIVICGGQSDLSEHKDFLFRQRLRERMGLPREPMPVAPEDDEDNDENNENMPPLHNPPPAPVVRSPLREISAPPSPIVPVNRRDDEDLEPRRRRVPSTSSTLLPSVSRSRVSSTTSAYFASNASTAVDSAALSMALSPTLRATAPTLVTRNAPPSPTMSDFEEDFDFNMLDDIENQALTTTSKPAPAQVPALENRSAAAAGSSRPKIASTAGSLGNREPEDLTLMEVGSKETAFPKIFSSPPSRSDRKLHLTSHFTSSLQSGQAKGKAASKTPFPTVNNESDDFFDDSTMDLGSDDLRQLESVEQHAFPPKQNSSTSASRTRTSSTSVTITSGASSSGQRRVPRAPPSSQPPRANAQVIVIASDDDDSSDEDGDMEVDDKENVPVQTRRVRPRVVAGAARVAASQRVPASQRARPRPIARASDPDDIVEISD